MERLLDTERKEYSRTEFCGYMQLSPLASRTLSAQSLATSHGCCSIVNIVPSIVASDSNEKKWTGEDSNL